MGATYTRQSSYTDGDVITAAHTNNEFDQLLAAFQASTGHTHDGTANEGGAITKLLGNTLTFGAATAGTDITVTFDGESNDGVLKWMEDEDYFEFSDDILISSTEKLYFQDTGTYIHSNADGDLDLVSDGTNADAIKLASAGGVTLDAAADITLDAGGADVVLKDDGTQYGSFTNTSGNLIIKSGSTTAVTFSGANTTFAGTVTIGSAEISETELEILDGATVTTTELNIMDGDTTASSTTVADADRVVFNDAGTMKQVAVTDLAAYFDDEITAMPNLVTTAATTVGALNSGSITSGFGTIDTGSSTITTTGLITGGSLDIDDVVINGTTIGHTDDTDLLTVASGLLTVAGEISVTTLDIGGTNVTSTAAELNILDGVTATATELNIIDGDTTASSTTVADADRVVLNDNGTMKQVAVTDLSAYFDDEITAMPNLVTTGTLNSGAISSGFGNIDIGSSNLTATGTISLGATSFNDNAITNVGDIALDSISADGTDINVAVSDNSGTAFTIKQGSDAYLIVDTGNSSESVSIGTGISGTAITLGHSTSEVTVADNLTVTGDLTVSGTTTTVNSTTVNLNDHNIVLDSGNSTSAVINGAGITIEGGSGSDATFTYNTTGPQFELKLGSAYEDLQIAKLTATELDISGDADIAGTTNLDNTDIDGTLVVDGSNISLDSTSTLNIDNSNTSNGITIGTATSGVPVSIGHTTSETTVNDNMTVTGTMTQTGVSTSTAKDIFNAGMSIKNGATSAGFVEFFEDSDNGTNKVTLIGPSSTADVTLTLPNAAGTVATTDDATALAIALG